MAETRKRLANAAAKANGNVVQLHPAHEPDLALTLLDGEIDEPQNPALDAARYIASLGGRIFPLPPGKKAPPPTGWQRIATSDPEQITAWLKNGGNYGVATGNGWVVLDIDVKDGIDGFAALRKLEGENESLPATMTVSTPSGGEHRYFRTSRLIKNSAKTLAPNLDVRGEGGYVVGPGSRLPNGTYDWIRRG